LIFNNSTAVSFNFNAVLGDLTSTTITRGSIEYNTFLGSVKATFGSTSSQAFTYNTVGNGFETNTINANITRCTLPPNWKNKTITSSMTDLNVLANDKVGLGVDSPTAVLHLKAGTASAGTAPLKFSSGTLNSTSEAGTVEYDGTNFYFNI